jgi:RNA polymerase sigma factor (sigma-70 family)
MTPEEDARNSPRDLEMFLQPLCEQREKFLRFVGRRLTARPVARRDPEEILQEAFARALARRAAFATSGMSLEAWFYRVVNDTLIEDHRFHTRQKRDCGAEIGWPDRSSAQFAAGLQDSGTSPSEVFDRERLKERVDRVLGELPPDDQEVIILITYVGLSGEAAAEVLGVTSGAVRKRHFHARARFRAAWKKTFGAEGFGV